MLTDSQHYKKSSQESELYHLDGINDVKRNSYGFKISRKLLVQIALWSWSDFTSISGTIEKLNYLFSH